VHSLHLRDIKLICIYPPTCICTHDLAKHVSTTRLDQRKPTYIFARGRDNVIFVILRKKLYVHICAGLLSEFLARQNVGILCNRKDDDKRVKCIHVVSYRYIMNTYIFGWRRAHMFVYFVWWCRAAGTTFRYLFRETVAPYVRCFSPAVYGRSISGVAECSCAITSR
jgi:hypothetical protein